MIQVSAIGAVAAASSCRACSPIRTRVVLRVPRRRHRLDPHRDRLWAFVRARPLLEVVHPFLGTHRLGRDLRAPCASLAGERPGAGVGVEGDLIGAARLDPLNRAGRLARELRRWRVRWKRCRGGEPVPSRRCQVPSQCFRCGGRRHARHRRGFAPTLTLVCLHPPGCQRRLQSHGCRCTLQCNEDVPPILVAERGQRLAVRVVAGPSACRHESLAAVLRPARRRHRPLPRSVRALRSRSRAAVSARRLRRSSVRRFATPCRSPGAAQRRGRRSPRRSSCALRAGPVVPSARRARPASAPWRRLPRSMSCASVVSPLWFQAAAAGRRRAVVPMGRVAAWPIDCRFRAIRPRLPRLATSESPSVRAREYRYDVRRAGILGPIGVIDAAATDT